MTSHTQTGSESFMIMYGSQTFKHTSSKVTTHIFEPGGVLKLNSYLNQSMTPIRGTSAKVPAANNDHSYNHGQWYRQSYVFEEGKILGFKLYSTINGALRAHSILMVRLRADGPYLTVNAVLTPSAKAAYQKLPVFSGRADVLSPKEARQIGVQISKQMMNNLMDAEEVEEDFEISILDPGTPKPKYEVVVTSSGEEKLVTKPTMVRRIRVRR